MFATASQPSLQAFTLWLGLAIAVMVPLGIATLIWGRLLHRGLLVAVGAGIGLVLGTWMARKLDLNLMVVRAVLAVTLAILGLVLARVVWAVLAGALAASLAAGAVMVFHLNVQFAATQPAAAGDLLADSRALAEHVLAVAWGNCGGLAVVAACVAGAAALAAGLLLPRATAIFMTAAIGASLTTGGLALAVIAFGGSLLWTTWMNPYVHDGLYGGLLAAGLVVQSVLELRARHRQKRAESDKKKAGGAAKSGGKSS